MVRKIKSIYAKIPSFLKNRYAITLMVFVTWMLFFDAHNFLTRLNNIKELREANAKKAYYMQQVEQVKQQMDELKNNTETLERFAREKYMMKKPDEDIFIIVEE